MNDNTILRIKVPAHLYESVKEQLSLKEAKAKQNLGAGMEVVKEKKDSSDKPKKISAPKAPKAHKAEAPEMKKKERTLDELKAAHKALTDKIKELEEYHEPENVYDDEIEDDSKKPQKDAKDKEPIKEYSNKLYQWYPDVEECWQVDDEGNQIQEVSIEYCQRKSERR
jgi:hypothetical protein